MGDSPQLKDKTGSDTAQLLWFFQSKDHAHDKK